MLHNLRQRLAHRRENAQFQRAYRLAEPRVQLEMTAAMLRQTR